MDHENTLTYYWHCLSDKNVIDIVCNSCDSVRTPRVVCKMNNGILCDSNYNIIDRTELFELLKRENEVFIKPTVDTCSGFGCKAIDRCDLFNEAELNLLLDSYGKDFVIQEVVKCSTELASLNQTSVNTFRIITYYLDGKIYHMPIILRIGRNGNRLDNAHQCGIFIGVHDDGSLLAEAHSEFGEMFEAHPDSGVKFSGYTISGVSKIIVVHKKNGGLVSARKAGASKAHGDYILNIDGDDWIEYDYLEMISNAIDDSNYADIIIWGTTLCSNNSRTPYKIWKNTFGLYTGESVKEISHRFLYDKNESEVNSGTVSIILVTKAVKTQLYREQQERVNNNVTKGEDALLSFYLLQKANSVLYLDYYGYNYRYVEQSMSNCVNEKDFIILSDLVTTMKKNVDNERVLVNQVSVYALWRIMGLLAPLSKIVTFREFKKTLNTVESCLFEAVSESVVYNKRLKDSVKLYLIRHRLWFAMYLILKRM